MESTTRTRIVGVVAERTAERVRAEAARAAPLADLLEVRLDHLEDGTPPADLLPGLPLPAIATCRLPADGGRWTGSGEERLALLAAAAAAGAAYVDLEAGAGPLPGGVPVPVIRSLHLPPGSGEAPREALRRLEAESGDVLKLCLDADDAPRALEALRLLAGRAPGDRPLATMATGRAGTATRLLQPAFGGALVYAASRRCREVLPGMPTLQDLEGIYGLRRTGRRTSWFVLLGSPLNQSVSPWSMNAAFRAAGMDALYVPVPTGEGEAATRVLLELGVAGMAFTAPYKAIPLWMSSLTEAVAAHAVAANTLYRKGDVLVAANTDGPAARRLAREALGSLEGKTALILGNGATARAVAAALGEERCTVHLLGRNPDKTDAAAATAGARAGMPPEPAVDLLVQATPVGQWPGPARNAAEELAPGVGARVRLDAVYNPRETAFLAAPAEKRIRGVDLLVAQGVDQLRFFGLPRPDAELMLRVAEEGLERMEKRILLIGMRGAGKSSVGRALAAATGRPFLDTDVLVEERTGRTPAEIFALWGEVAFRDIERQTVRWALRRRGTVVAVGGGATRALESLPPNTAVAWIRARPGTLAARLKGSGRPSLTGRPPEEEVAEVLAGREPDYRRLSTFAVDTDEGTPEEAAAEVASAFGL